MQADDYNCMECGSQFDAASSLLQHFAQHVVENLKCLSSSSLQQQQKTHKKLPELLPIGLLKLQKSINNRTINEFDPTRFCLVTLDDDDDEEEYKCDYCGGVFVCSTDFKKTDTTNKKQFVCKFCLKGFTGELKVQQYETNCQKNNR